MTTAIEALDAALAEVGEDIILRRIIGTGPSKIRIDVTARAMVRTVAPDVLVGTQKASTIKVILSPTEIAAAQWPGGRPPENPPATVDPAIPRPGDIVIIKRTGRSYSVILCGPMVVGGILARIELTAEG